MAAAPESRKHVLSMLTILLATCETTLHTLHAADNPGYAELTDFLEKMIERTRLAIEALSEATADLL
jgi:hypothetical protein